MLFDFFSVRITINEMGGVEIKGIDARKLEYDIGRLYNTSVIGKYMFLRSGSVIRTREFFLLELHHIVSRLLTVRRTATKRKQLIELKDLLESETWIKNTINPVPYQALQSYLAEFIKTPFPTQKEFLDSYLTITKNYKLKGLLLDGKAGSGKAQTLSSLIKVPNGWKKMGNIKVGDTVIAKDGSHTKVTGVFPQGITEVYRVHFKDGRYTDCNPEHLWNVYEKNKDAVKGKPWGERWHTESLRYIMQRLKENKHERIYIPLCEPEDGPAKEFKIHPYLMGVLLGDGSLSGSTPYISKPYQELFDKVQKLLPPHLSCKWVDDVTFNITLNTPRTKKAVDSHITKDLREMDLMGKRSWEKVIPVDYLLNSNKQQRLELLQGLLDTDGTAGTKKTISFSSSSKQLALGVQYLVRSLGGIALLSTRIPHYSYKGEKKSGRTDYRLSIRYPRPEELFTLTHKRERATQTQYSDNLKLEIVNIEKRANELTQCISVDHPSHLYITDDFIVTHNTILSLMWSRMLNGNNTKTIILCPPKLVDKVWKETLDKEFRVVPPYWTSMSGLPLDTSAEFFILHYDFLTNKGFEEFERFMMFYKKSGNQFKLIIDECHNFNEPTSNRTQMIIELSDKGYFSHTLPMSGTPLKACSKESYAIFSLTDPLFVGLARERFKDAYGRGRERLNELFARRIGRNKFTIAAIDGMDEAPDTEVINVSFKGAEQFTIENIRLRMLNYIRERYAFYQANLPSIRSQYLACVDKYEEKIKRDATALQELELYKRYVHDFNKRGFNTFTDGDKSKFCKSVEEKIEGVLAGRERLEFRSNCSAVKYVSLKIQGEVIGNVFGAARRECAKAIIEHAGLIELVNHVEKKTLFFSTYVEAVEAAEEYFLANGFKPVTITGKNLGNTDSEIKRFENDPNTNPLITTYKSLKEGYPLTMANQLIMIDVPYRDYEVIQTKARIHRKGQDSPTFFWCLRLDTGDQPNISTTTLDILQWSRDQVAEMMLDIAGHELGNVFNEITGNELYEISLEPDTVPVSSWRTPFDLFK